MQKAIDKVMYAHSLLTQSTPAQVQATRDRLAKHLAEIDADEDALAVEGMRYLRGGEGVSRRRTGKMP